MCEPSRPDTQAAGIALPRTDHERAKPQLLRGGPRATEAARPGRLAAPPGHARQGAARSPLVGPRRRRELRPCCSRGGGGTCPLLCPPRPTRAGRGPGHRSSAAMGEAAPGPGRAARRSRLHAGRAMAATLPGSGTPSRPMWGRAPLLSRWERAASQSATVRATWLAAGRPRGPPPPCRVPCALACRRRATSQVAGAAASQTGRGRAACQAESAAARRAGRCRPPYQGHLPTAPLHAFLKKIRKREKEEEGNG